MSHRNKFEGMRFSHLTVLRYGGDSCWICRCDCGVEKMVRGSALWRGHTKSCGCKAAELRIAAAVARKLEKNADPKPVKKILVPTKFEPDYS